MVAISRRGELDGNQVSPGRLRLWSSDAVMLA